MNKSDSYKEEFLDKVFIRATSLREREQRKKNGALYFEMADIMFIYYIKVGVKNDGCLAGVLKRSILEKFGISEDELRKRACANTALALPVSVRGYAEMMAEEYGVNFSHCLPDGEELEWIVTNELFDHGSTVLAYPGLLKRLSEKLEDDLIILPSSVHEVIAIRASGRDEGSGFLTGMVSEINKSEVSDEEVLSNHAYHYSRKEDKFEALEDWERRRATA